MNKLNLFFILLSGSLVAALVAQQPAAPTDGSSTSQQHHASMSGDISKDMRMMNEKMVKMLGKGDAEYEKRFIDMMIPHHEGAILMAQDALKNATKPELKKMAEKMIEDQSKEIKMLKEYRMQWYGK
jgi:uncharacterized protein (DUF305 family)